MSRAQAMHDNSLQAYREEEVKLSRRAQAVLDWITEHGPSTDRQVMWGMGFTDMNSVRPRITELIDCNKLMQVCSVTCPITAKTVRKVDVRKARGQLEMGLQ